MSYITKYGFLKAVTFLTDDDWLNISELKNKDILDGFYTDYIVKETYNTSRCTLNVKCKCKCKCCIIEELIVNGDVYNCWIENAYDPTDKNLYTTILNLLN